MKEVRTRFAPSPTGFMHIGNLRTALYAYLLAKKNNGKFILRIEDTDQERFVEGSIDLVYKTLSISGLNYDEGPNIGGNFGPYIQSQRKDIYLKYARELINSDGAYFCFCSKDRLDSLRKKAENEKIPFKYDGYCKKLTQEEIKQRIDKGEKYTIRQNIVPNEEIVFNDLVFGEIKTNSNDLDEGVLIKSNGLPTYNFANVIDDHLMQISHIIRGTEYISSTPKYILLYNSFGWEVPEHIHLPLILKNSSQKFSKRDGDASFVDLLERGYLKDAIINYIVLLGWHPKNEQEIFSLKDLEGCFDISGLHKASAIFDINKLNWMNSEYIKKLDFNEFYKFCLPYYQNLIKKSEINILNLTKLLQTRIVKIDEIPAQIDFVEKLPNYNVSLFENNKMKSTKKISLDILKTTLVGLENMEPWTEENIRKYFFDIIKQKGMKNGQVLWPIRVALSGKEFTPGGSIEIAHFLGYQEVKNRLKIAINKLIQEINIPSSSNRRIPSSQDGDPGSNPGGGTKEVWEKY